MPLRSRTLTRRVSALVAALLLTSFASPPARAFVAPATPTFLLKWGSSGSGAGQFSSPFFLATDALGNVYVPDPYNNRVQKFDGAGNFLLQWGTAGTGNGQLNAPSGIAIDASGNVYVTDYFNNRVQKFDANGTYLLQWGTAGSGSGQFNGPEGIAIDAAGNVYVGDYSNNRIEKFSGTGAYLGQWGSGGSGSGQFNGPEGLAIDYAGNVLVVDSYGNRVEKFSAAGAYLAQWGGTGSGAGQFNYAGAIAVDALGFIYVADVNNARVQKFSRTGAYLGLWGTNGSGNGQFNGLFGVGVNAAGDVYTTEYNGNRIQKFSGAGFTPAAATFPAYAGSYGAAHVPIATAPYLGSYYLMLWSGGVSAYSAGFSYLGEMVADASAQSASDVVCSTVLGKKYCMVVNGSQNLVGVWDLSSGYALFDHYLAGGSSPAGFSGPSCLAVNSLGNVFITDTNDNRIIKDDQAGGLKLAQWGSAGTGNGQFNHPVGIAVNNDSSQVYVVDSGNSRVQVFTYAGAYVRQWGSAGSSVGQFISPTDIAVLPGGNVVVVDNGNHRLQEFTPTGTYVLSMNAHTGSPSRLCGTATGAGLVVSDPDSGLVAFDDRVLPQVQLVSDVGHDQGGQVRVRFTASSLDVAGSLLPVQGYVVQRGIDYSFPPSWTTVGTVYPHGQSEYSVIVPTGINATPATVNYATFRVHAVTADARLTPDSPGAPGYSIDNLSPPPPTAAIASAVNGSTTLSWTASNALDLAGYRVYRGADATFEPSPATLVASTPLTTWTDANVVGASYKITAVDVNGNESDPALASGGTAGVSPPAPRFALAGVTPNPARAGALGVRFALPEGSPARLELLDVAGRIVRTRAVGALGAGEHAVDLAAGAPVAPGLYFVRLTQGARTQSARVTVLE